MKLSTCGCCAPSDPPTPERIWNREGLPSIAYRIGTFASFREAMRRAIASFPELRELGTRRGDDYTMTFIEQWAVIADVLTFYQERFANEAFLRTALHRQSIIRLAELIDYRLRPGVAATTLMTFDLDRDKRLTIPVGLRVQSVPGDGEQPQKFETVASLEADAALDEVRILPRPRAVNPFAAGGRRATLSAGSPPVSAGDKLVLFRTGTHPAGGSSPPAIEDKRAAGVSEDFGLPVLEWSPAVTTTRPGNSALWAYRRKLRLYGVDAPASWVRPVTIPEPPGIDWVPTSTAFETFHYGGLPDPVMRRDTAPGGPGNNALDLDAEYDDLAAGTELLIVVADRIWQQPDTTEASVRSETRVVRAQIERVERVTATWGPLSGPTTRIVLDDDLLPGLDFDTRKVVVYELVDEPLALAHREYDDVLTGDKLWVRGTAIDHIDRDRRLLLDDLGGEPLPVEVAGTRLRDTDGDGNADHLEITVSPPLERALDARSAVMRGNVVEATHGETVKDEILGNGDTASDFQTFELRRKPLTYLPSAAPEGVASTLQVLVDRVRWHEVPTLYGVPPAAEVFTTRLRDDGTTEVRFGGRGSGSRLPSGRGNVVASYRQGSGLAGRLAADTLTTLLDRPAGLRGVTNTATVGGADPESLDDARDNAPATVRTFGRVVSLRDLEDAALSTGEVAKARATWVWTGEQRVAHLTVAAQKGALFSSDALARIHASLGAQRVPHRVLLIDNFTRVPLVGRAKLLVDDRYVAQEVHDAARSALLEALSFERLPLALPLHSSDVYAVLQGVDGVVAVDLDLLQFKDRSAAHLAERGATTAPVQGHLRIYPARPGATATAAVRPAEQAWIETPDVDVRLRTSGGLPS